MSSPFLLTDKETGDKVYVDAASKAGAYRYMAEKLYTARALTKAELFTAVKAGVPFEVAASAAVIEEDDSTDSL